MAKFTIPVCRIGYSIKEIEVEADTQEAAEALALEQAPNESYGSEHASDYVLEGEVDPVNRVLIHVEGGVVQDVFADNPSGVEVILRDADTEGSEHDIAADGNLYTDDDGYRYSEVDYGASPWSNLETQPFANPVKPEDV